MIQPRPVLDIPIFHKIYDLYKLLHNYRSHVPKAERYTLWQKCENTVLTLLEVLIETSYETEEERIHSLYVLSNKLDLLKVLIRLAKETRTVDDKSCLQIQTLIQEIGKMVGGWIKSVPHKSF